MRLSLFSRFYSVWPVNCSLDILIACDSAELFCPVFGSVRRSKNHMIPKMLFRLFGLLLVGVGCGLAQVTVPDTPAGHTLQAWLAAFNSGDRTSIETYVKTIDHSQSVDGMISFRNQTGGFELLSIESSQPLHIRFRVKEKGGLTTALGNLLVKDEQPPVGTFGLRALPPGAVLENVTLDAAERKKVIND